MHARRMAQAATALGLAAWALATGFEVRAADDGFEKEVMVRVVTSWNAGCTGNSLADWDDMVLAWYNDITNGDVHPRGHAAAAWSQMGAQTNGNIVDSDFIDSGTVAWGNDVLVADAEDALMIGMHGGNNGPDHRWFGKVRVDEAGTGNCRTYQGNIVLGDNDLEFLHLSSCYSMDREDWWPNWNSTFDGLHQIEGFHGLMWISDHYSRRYKDFSDDAFWITIADSWMDHLFINEVHDEFDQCPVARNVGSNSNDSRSRMNWERYNYVLSDPPGLGSARAHRARYIRGCAPDGKEALPQ